MKSNLISLSAAVDLLRQDQVVAIPTETVYGLAASISSLDALGTVFTLKGRPPTHPLIIHLVKSQSLFEYAEDIPDYVSSLVETFCPGPLTFILNRAKSVPLLVTGGQDTVGVRFPAHPLTQSLIQAVGNPLAAPSANRFGCISPTRPEHVFSEFKHLPILDGGACELGIESTIIDATDFSTCAILRHGHITQQDLQNALGSSIKVLDTPLKKRQVSGTLKKHYAPSKPAFLFSTEVELQSLKERFQTLSVLRYSASQANMPSSPNLYSKELYHQLRMADCASTEAIAIEAPPATSDWLAISDRLTRACVCYDKGDEQ